MQNNFNDKEEDTLKESTDSDRYCFDDLDLLNLRVSFSSDATGRSRGRTRNSIHLGRGDSQRSHVPRRCQHSRARLNSSSGDYNRSTNTTHVLRSPSQPTRGERGHSVDERRTEADGKSVLLLYSNLQHFPVERQTQKANSEQSFPQERKRRSPRTRTVDIHTISHTMAAHRSVKESGSNEPNRGGEAGTFPFKLTPSGNLKVDSKQVVFESHKFSVLVADPKHTKVNIHPESGTDTGRKGHGKMHTDQECPRNSVMESIMGHSGFGGSLGSLIASTAPVRREKEASEYEGKVTDQILDPELNLNRLGYTPLDPIDWEDVKLPEKTNLYLELYQRITNYTNADCKIYIDNEEFNCHLIVLQCYSEVFDEFVAMKKVELPSDKVSTSAFAFIYDWMITGEPAYMDLSRESVLDIFNASKYLKVKDLTEQCWAFIDNTEVFSEDTAFLLYMDAKDKDLDDVRELMLPRIQKFFLMLVSSQDWLDIDKDDVVSILSSNYICVNCEMEVFMSAIRWLKHRWEERQEDLMDVINCVRFGNIAPWQLVDIKRNPENPEFLKLTTLPAICKMIDDGLAFVIIKYWYGQENDDFQHWNSILGLQEPPPRNWSGMDKSYFTYREFLIYLDQYRRSQMIEKSKPKDKRRKNSVDVKTSPQLQTLEKTPPHVPTMDEFLTGRKAISDNASGHQKKLNKIRRKGDFRQSKVMSRNEAATIIQSAFRGFLVRRMVKHYIPHCDKYVQPKKKSEEFPWRNQSNIKVMAMFSQPPRNEMMLTQNHYMAEKSLFNADRESVLVFGGVDPHNSYGVARNTGKDVFRYVPDSNIWEYIGELPEPRHHHSVAFLKGRVYLCGGADPRDDGNKGRQTVVDTVWSFEPVKRCWFNEGNLITPRKNFGLIASNLSMFAIGGQDRVGRTLASVEKFHPETGNWELQAPLKNPRMGIACTKYRDHIWVAGGMSGSRKSPVNDCVECYDIRKNQWTEITKLRFPRCFGCMFSMSDRLYLIGGASKMDENEKTTTSISAIDMWDAVDLEWKHQTDMAIPRHGHTIAYLGTQILIIGGVTTVYMRALSNTECYCTERGTWVRGIACLPTTLSGHAAITLPPASLM